jgi:cation transport regulator ChaC
MKKITLLFASLALIAFTNASFAQLKLSALNSEIHQTLSTQLATAKTQALAVAKDTSKSNTEKLKNVETVLKNLEAVKSSHQSIKSATPDAKKSASQKINAALEGHHAEATKYATYLKQELQKTSPDNAKIQSYSKSLSDELDKIEKEHQSLQTSLK